MIKYLMLILVFTPSFIFAQCVLPTIPSGATIGVGATVVNQIANTAIPVMNRNGISNAIEKLESGNATIVYPGDSNTTSEVSKTGEQKKNQWSKGNYCGTGWQSAANFNFNPLGTFKAQTGTFEELRQLTSPSHPVGAPAGGGLIHESRRLQAGAAITFAVISADDGSDSDNADIYYDLGTGDFEWSVNNGATTFIENSTGTGLGILNVDFGAIGDYSLKVEALENDFIIHGINRYIKNCTGVMIHKGGFSGYGPGHLIELITIQSNKDIIVDLAPDLLVIDLGSNHSGFTPFNGWDTSPNGLAGHVEAYALSIQSLTNCEVLILGPPDKAIPQGAGTAHPITMKEYDAAFYEMAMRNGFGWGSHFRFHGDFYQAQSQGVTDDGIHFTPTIGSCRNETFISRILGVNCG